MFEDILGFDKWRLLEKINRGWSDDVKYYIETYDNQKLLLRVSNIEKYEAKKKEYEVIQRYAELGFIMSQPLSFGVCNHKQNTYMLLTWIEGEDLELALPKLDLEQQYLLGREAGSILKKIHSLNVPEDEIPSITKIPKKRRQIQSYIESKARIAGDEEVIKFINENLDKLWSKPPVYQHGDFHPGNLILTPEGKVGVIDFNRWEIGDPYEEFYKLESFGTDFSIPYCRGQIDSYFKDHVPEDFWEILAIYVAHASLYSIKWAEKFGQDDIDHMIGICKKSLLHYDNFKKYIPSWY